MTTSEYGLPGVSALDSPYGLTPPAAPIGTSEAPAYVPIRLPGVLSPMRPREPQAGTGVLRNEHLPNNVTPLVPGNIPVIGKDISVDDFINLHKKKESGTNYQALNREKPGNTASGAYQYTDATWNNYGGYAKALLAPREVQDRRYREDLMSRINKYGGDPFRAMAEHYLPALANDPRRWGERFKFKNGSSVDSVATYLRQMAKGSQLEKPLEDYLRSYGIQ